MMSVSKPCGSSGGRRALNPIAEAAKTAGVLFPLTPALSPRRGRNIRPCFGNPNELGFHLPPKRKTKERGLQPQRPNFPAPSRRSPAPGAEAGGTAVELRPGERSTQQQCPRAGVHPQVVGAGFRWTARRPGSQHFRPGERFRSLLCATSGRMRCEP